MKDIIVFVAALDADPFGQGRFLVGGDGGEQIPHRIDLLGAGNRHAEIPRQPRDLLARVPGLSLKEMSECEECCGFGGAFSVKFGEVSTKIVDRKCDAIAAAGADAVVGGDLGCLMNIEGRLRRRGDETTRVLHIAEVLAGGEA